jgi:hypothetical protein
VSSGVFPSGQNSLYIVGFQVLVVASMKMAVFWVVEPCSLIGVYRRFRGACCVYHYTDYGDSLCDDGSSKYL